MNMNTGISIVVGPNVDIVIDQITFGTGVDDTKFRISGADCVIDGNIPSASKIYLYNLLVNAYYTQATITVNVNKVNSTYSIINMTTLSSNLNISQ